MIRELRFAYSVLIGSYARWWWVLDRMRFHQRVGFLLRRYFNGRTLRNLWAWIRRSPWREI